MPRKVHQATTSETSCAIVPEMAPAQVTSAEQAESITVVDGGEFVVVQRGESSRRIPARWLRLLADGASDIDPATGHRLFDSTSLPSEFKVRSALFDEATGQWDIRFEGETTGIGCNFDRLLGVNTTDEINGPERTAFSSADSPLRAVDYDMLEAPAALRSFLDTLLRRGYARVREVPNRKDELVRFASRLRLEQGLIQPGSFEQVRASEASSGDTSHGSIHGSMLHTDEPYRDPVPGFHVQLCLESAESGGETIVADGLSIADTLAAEEPFAAVELARWPMLFAQTGPNSDRRRAVPLLETAPDGSLLRITFNDRAARDFICPDDRLPICASAYDTLARIVQREGFQNTFRVKAGDLLIIDNERLLHGHRPVSGTGIARFACGYLDRGDLMSTWRRARAGLLD